MKRAVWKFPLELANGGRGLVSKCRLPRGARVLDVQIQPAPPLGKLCLWALVDPEAPSIERIVFVVGTGWEIDAGAIELCQYIGTVQDGQLVWHVFLEPETKS